MSKQASLYLITADEELRGMCAELMGRALPGLAITGSAADGESALAEIRREDPDLVLIDLEIPGSDGLRLMANIKHELPMTKVILFAASGSRQDVRAAIEDEVDGFILKGDGMIAIKAAVEAVLDGRPFFSPAIARRFLEMKFDGARVLDA